MNFIQTKDKTENMSKFFKDNCDALNDLVPFVQFKKREKHPWRSADFSNTKINTPPWVFFTFFKL